MAVFFTADGRRSLAFWEQNYVLIVQDKGGDSIEAQHARIDLGMSLAENGRWEECLQDWKDQVSTSLRKHGPRARSTLHYQAVLAIALWVNGRKSEAIGLIRDVIEKWKRKLRPKSRILKRLHMILATMEEWHVD